MKRDDVTLLDIAHSARVIVRIVGGRDKQLFFSDATALDAALYRITVLGEASKRLSPDFRNEHPDIPWRKIAGMRDRVIHLYDQVDLDEVWKAVSEDVPDLLAKIEPFLPKEEED